MDHLSIRLIAGAKWFCYWKHWCPVALGIIHKLLFLGYGFIIFRYGASWSVPRSSSWRIVRKSLVESYIMGIRRYYFLGVQIQTATPESQWILPSPNLLRSYAFYAYPWPLGVGEDCNIDSLPCQGLWSWVMTDVFSLGTLMQHFCAYVLLHWPFGHLYLSWILVWSLQIGFVSRILFSIVSRLLNG